MNVRVLFKPGSVGLIIFVALIMLARYPRAQERDAQRYWPQWRGPNGNGIAPSADPPLEWSETRNVRWKVEVPGRGLASPVVWGDRIFVTSAVPVGVTGDAQHAPRGGLPQRGLHRFVVLAIDRLT